MEAREPSNRPFEITAPPGWTKTPEKIGFTLTDGELLVNASGPFPRSELEGQKQLIERDRPGLTWTHERIAGGELTATNIEVEGRGARVGFYVEPAAHVLVTLDAPRPIGSAEADLFRTIAATVEIRRVVTPEEAGSSDCPDDAVQAAHTQGLCLDPARFGKERVQACVEHFAAEGIGRAPEVEAGILADSGVSVVCWEPPSP